jgi:arabinofuranan 3-O-arabinosyltransferase
MCAPSPVIPPVAAPASHDAHRRRRWRPAPADLAVWAGLAVISYLPSFLTQPGKIAADTKQYLYLDPGRLIQSAISMWDPDVGAGTVTHQNIGFLFPMGPYYWLVTEAHIPIWIGQRFWMGSLFFVAGTGVWFLGRLLGLSRAGQLAAALAYMLTPYVLDYITRISAIVMPWAALGWMLALTVLAVRRGGWRYPALFAVVIALVGGVNATSILLVGLAPLLWVLYAVWGTREVTVRAAGAAAVRIGVLGLGVSLWWMAGLWAEGAYGINVLKYTETLPTVSSTSLSSEVLRGLGYWYFYGQDKLGPWTAASLGYLQWTWLIVVSFMVPTVCITAAMVARWRYRVFAIALVVVGVVLAVGTYPFTDPTPFGALIKAAGSDSTVGLALRSTNRIVPLVLLGLALLLGAGITAVVTRVRWVGLVLLALCAALIAADLPPLWNGGLVAGNLDRPTAIPTYIHEAAAYMDGQDHDTRVLQLPGQDFAYYRWGVTSDPVWPGLMTRPYLIRSAVPVGEAGSVNLLQALDESIQDGVAVPSTLAPIAGLLSAGDILYESDVQFERFGTARPQPFWLVLNSPAAGLGTPTIFGTPRLYPTIEYPLTDETQLAIPTGASVPPPVAVFPVPDARPIARTESASDPLLVAGDGQGLVEAAAAGLLASNPTILYSATFAHDPAGLSRQLGHDAVLVLTDTNRKQLSTWGTVVDNYGYVEQADETPLVDNPAEASLPVFPDAGSGTQTVAVVTGVASVRATAYSNPITNTAENQPLNAVDGDPDTAWTEGAFSPATGQSIQVDLVHPVTTDHITLLQPQTGPRNRTVTDVTLTFDGHSPVTASLGAASDAEPGQVVSFPKRTFSTLTVTVNATSAGVLKDYRSQSAVGFSEITIPGVAPATEVLRLPTDLLAAAGPSSLAHALDILVNRIRTQVTPPRSDPEASMARQFTLPTARTFSIGGTARISTLDPDPTVDALVGRTGRGAGTSGSNGRDLATVVYADSSGRLPGDLDAGAASAVDGNPATSWSPGLGDQVGNWVEYRLDEPVTFDHLDLQVVADGKHSIPTAITVATPTASRTVTLPPIAPGAGRTQGSVTPVPVSFPALTGSDVKITIDAVEPHQFLDYLSNSANTDPVALAEVGIPGVAPVTAPAAVPAICHPDLVAVDGRPVDIEITGSTSTALDNGGLTIRGCGNAAQGVTLSAGTHTLTTSTAQATGLDVDALALGSAAGGAAEPLTPAGLLPAPPAHPTAPVTVVHQDRTSMTVTVHGDGQPTWLVLGQSQSPGWKATTSTGIDLGSSTLIDGYANGWYLPAALTRGTTTFTLTWTPQRVVTVALVVSGVTLVVSMVLIALPSGLLTSRRRRHRRRRRAGAPGGTARTPVPPSTPDTGAIELGVEPGDDPVRPVLTSVLRSGGTTPGWATSLCLALVGGLVAGLIVAPAAGAVLAGVVLLELRVDRSRIVVVAGTVGLLAVTAGYVALHQRRNGFLSDINWPSHMGWGNSLVWVALCLLGADGLVQWVRHRRRAASARPTEPG